MKKLFNIILLLLLANIANAQAPQGIPYQAVARNSSGNILASQNIRVRFSIRDSVATSTIVYRETFTPTTNALGLFNVNVGTGTVVTGTFSGINWGTNAKFMQVELDPTGGTTYTNMGTTQMMSVPFALYAANSGSAATGWSIAGNTGINPSANFIGTSDNNALRFRVNNQWAGELNPSTSNTSFGLNAMPASSGYSNTANGVQSLYSNTVGYENTAYGLQSLNSNTTGYQNTAIGLGSMNANTTGVQNTANGAFSLFFNTTGYQNTATGYHSLYSNTTGYNNTAIGFGSLNSSTGINNTANGALSLFSNTTGNSNTAVGFNSLNANTTANDNTAIGYQSLVNTTTGGRNTGVGEGSLNSNTIGDNNIAVGSAAIAANTTGRFNTGVGVQSLLSNITGNNITAIGFGSDVIGTALNNASALGTLSAVNASNKVVIGNPSIGTIGGFANWSNLSDGRFKSQIKENVPGLDFILKLKPITYHFEARRFEHFLGRPDSLIQQLSTSYDLAESEVRTGFIAQEVEAAAKKIGYDFSGIHKPQNEKDNYSLAYAEFTVPIIKAIQEQQAEIERLKAENTELKLQARKLAELTVRLESVEASLNNNLGVSKK